MSGKKTKLKKIKLTSVDMVRRGANQEAYINLYKSEDPPNLNNTPSNATESPNSSEIPQGLWKSIAETVKAFMSKGEATEPLDTDTNPPKEVEKAFEDNRLTYHDTLYLSIDSIINDDGLTSEQKGEWMEKSINQFAEAYKSLCKSYVMNEPTNPVVEKTAEEAEEVEEEDEESYESEESQDHEVDLDNEEEGDEEMKIDKSRFTDAELAQYNALIAKGRVDDDEPNYYPEEPEMHPEVRKALDEMEELKKSMEMKEMTDIAKKYAPLGKKEDELAKTLYEMKKSSEASYDAYIAVLDQNLDLVNKSGLFEEIGKSNRNMGGGSSIERAEGIAKNYMEKDPTMDYFMAIQKAYENNPELLDNEF